MSGQLFVNSDNDFRIKGFRDSRAAAGIYLNAATTKTWEVRTAADGGGTEVSSGSMEYVDSSNGEYVGGMDDSIELTVDTTYWLTVVLVEGGVRGQWDVPLVATRRTGRNPRG